MDIYYTRLGAFGTRRRWGTMGTKAGMSRSQRQRGVINGLPRVNRDGGARMAPSAADRLSLAGFYGCIALLHLIGWGLYLHYTPGHPALVGLGFVAYLFGLRHAFDADHIAAVDDSVRFMLQRGDRPLGVGFFFSLGHSTVVLVLSLAVALAAHSTSRLIPSLRAHGAMIGAGVSGAFLLIIGTINLLVLLDILSVWKEARAGSHDHARLESLLRRRGLLNRLFGARLQPLMRRSWQLYPLGLLFGLGFDTASEVGLLAMTAGAAAGDLPVAAVLSLPVLFAAGMVATDTTDGVLMSRAYQWAFVNPLRKIFYNLATTGLSVVVALGIGTIEVLQLGMRLLDRHGPFSEFVLHLDFRALGYLIVGLFLGAWALSAALWKLRRPECG